MLKIAGLVFVLISAGAGGFLMAKELNDRIKLLKETEFSAINIKSDMEYRCSRFSDCFSRRGKLFDSAAKHIENGSLPAEALKLASEKQRLFSKDDRAIIKAYADSLSAEDIGSQIASISWFIDAMHKTIKEAEKEYAAKNRLYKSGGLLFGLGFLIFLL